MTARAVQEARLAWWALRALRAARRQLRADPLARPELPRVPLASAGSRTVERILYLTQGSCLETAAVRQAWLAACGQPRDLVIGVTSPARFHAHAWLDGDPPDESAAFTEIHRRSA